MCDITSWFHAGTVSGMQVSSRSLEFKHLPHGTTAARLRRLMDERFGLSYTLNKPTTFTEQSKGMGFALPCQLVSSIVPTLVES